MKYQLIMKDDKTGEWKLICTSGSRDELQNIANSLNADGEDCLVEEVDE